MNNEIQDNTKEPLIAVGIKPINIDCDNQFITIKALVKFEVNDKIVKYEKEIKINLNEDFRLPD